jgi:PKD repeat protein
MDEELNTYSAHMEFALKTFGIELTAIKTPSATASATGSPTIVVIGDYNALPKAILSFSPAQPTTADTVQFSDRSTDADGRIAEWNWNFGDGATSTQQNPTHRFSTKGSYTVALTVKDDKGATHSTSQAMEVVEPPFPYTYIPIVVGAVIGIVVIALILLRRKK